MVSEECPVSAITPESLRILHRFGRANIAKQDGGPLMYGPNLQDWPARYYDALVVITGAQNSIENAENKANPID